MVTDWTTNTIMFWKDGSTFRKITDHGRSPLNETPQRIETKERMADGTLRRYTIAKKRTWQCSWDNLPSTNSKSNGFTTADGGWAGEDIEDFHNRVDDDFEMQLRRGDGTVETVVVMITDFSKEILKRGVVDIWSLDITLEEV